MYKDSGYPQEWGDAGYDGTYPSGTVSGPHAGDGSNQVYTVYGEEYASLGQPAGTYTDTVTVHY
ncbi:MAG: spore coat protein U domain-containing protein [bacterium]|nr:spore coat protein U domain-containing protein [bacterium]